MATVTGSKRHLDITSDTLNTSSNVDVGAKLFITTTDSNTSSTTALVLNSTEVEARTLGSNAFNSTAFLTSETFSSSDVALVLSGNDIIAGTSITLAGGLSYNDSTNTLSQTDNNTVYSHPTFNGDDFDIDTGALTGATVISDLDINVTTNSQGHVTDANGSVSTRTLTLANLGYTGATNANYITNNNQLTNGAGYLTSETFGSSDVVLSLSGTDVTAGESITLAGGLSYSGTTLTSANDNTTYTAGTGLTLTGTSFSVTANTYAAASHNHTSLTGITSLSFAAQSSDAASITRTISGTGTYFDFNLTDDNNNDWWRWRFTPSGSTVYDAMVLKPVSNGNANLIVSGNVTADNFSGSSSGTNTGDQTLPTLSSLGAAASSHNHDGRYLRTHTRYSDDLDTINASGVYIWDVSEADDEPTGASDGLLTIKYWDSINWATASFQDFHNRTLHIKSKKSGTWQTDWAQVWTTDQLTTTNKSNYDTAYTHSQATHAPTNAQQNVQSDWNAVSGDAFIANKPSTFTPSSHAHNDLYYTEEETRLALANAMGWEASYGGGTASDVQWNFDQDCLELQNDTDTSIGAAYQAVYIKAGQTKRFTVNIKGDIARNAGMYIRLYQHNGNLPDGKTHVSNDAVSAFVQEDDSGVTNWYENGAISTDWVTYEKSYTATADGYVSLVILNWTSNGTAALYIRTPDIQTISNLTAGTNVSISSSGVISSTDTNTVYTHPTSAGNKHIPTGGAAGQFLKYSSSGTATWATPSYTTNTDTVYVHPTSAGNKHIPTGGSAGQFLKYSASGTATWATPSYTTNTDTVYTHPTSAGNKHIPTGGAAGQFLKYSSSGTAVWAADNNTTYSNATTSASGLMSSTDKTKLNGIASQADAYTGWNFVDTANTATRIDSLEYFKIAGSDISGTGTSSDPYLVNTPDTDTTYTADGDYGMTLNGTAFRLENDRRRNSSTQDIYTGNTHDYTFYDADVGIRWYTAAAEEMRLENDGDLHVDGDVVAFSTTVSDARLKNDVQTIENATEKVNQLRGVSYTWNAGSRKGEREIGVIAQEVEQVVPEIVHDKKLPFVGNETYKTVDYEKLVALLIESNKELTARVEQLEAKLDGSTK